MVSYVASQKLASIAIPALGTGSLGWPCMDVAKTIYETICEFDTNQGKTGVLKDVRLVVFDKDLRTCQVLYREFFLKSKLDHLAIKK